MLKYIILFFIYFLSRGTLSSQILLSHSLDNKLYMAHVKSLDEFIQRLNGKELHPLLIDSVSNKIRITRYALFDEEIQKNINWMDTISSVYKDFVYSIETDSTEISLDNSANWVEAKCRFIWKDAEKILTLKMQLEKDTLHYWRWTLFDVDGLDENGLLDDRDVLRISPVEHEINFMELRNLFFYDYTRMAGTRKTGVSIDRLSYFYGLVYSGLLKYDICQSVEFHCRQVPGYYFVTKEINRLNSKYSGWLIVSLTKT